jgi:hypothetical protein
MVFLVAGNMMFCWQRNIENFTCKAHGNKGSLVVMEATGQTARWKGVSKEVRVRNTEKARKALRAALEARRVAKAVALIEACGYRVVLKRAS